MWCLQHEGIECRTWSWTSDKFCQSSFCLYNCYIILLHARHWWAWQTEHFDLELAVFLMKCNVSYSAVVLQISFKQGYLHTVINMTFYFSNIILGQSVWCKIFISCFLRLLKRLIFVPQPLFAALIICSPYSLYGLKFRCIAKNYFSVDKSSGSVSVPPHLYTSKQHTGIIYIKVKNICCQMEKVTGLASICFSLLGNGIQSGFKWQHCVVFLITCT